MKITVAQYAKSLNEAVKNKSQSEIDLVVENFLKLLQKNRQMKLAKKIVEKFSNICNKENGIVEMKVTSRESLSPELSEKLRQYAMDKYQAKEVKIENMIDEKIKGGIILQIGDEMVDASVAGMLMKLKRELGK